MQLGARWNAGEPPHPGVPHTLVDAITRAEQESPSGESWTFTWLEGRPRVELLDAAGTVMRDLRVDASGRIHRVDAAAGAANEELPLGDEVTPDDDDWLS